MRWISADIARARARHLTGLLTATVAFAVLGAATPAHAATTYLISSFAHTTTPKGVAVDPAGDVYIADAADNDVVKVTPAGAATVVASGLNAPSGVAVDPSSGDVYIADTGDHQVDRLSPGGAVSIVAGTATAGIPSAGPAAASDLGGPSGLAVDSTGNLYIADTANNRVEEVTPADRLSFFAGTGAAGAPSYGASALLSALSAPSAVALTATGRTYVANTNHATVDRIAPALPALGAAPTPTGTTTQGQTLIATSGTWANAPTSYTYAWERCNAGGGACTNIAGASGPGHALTGDDAGATIRSLVTATNVTGAATVASNPTAVIIPQPPVTTGAPTIAGTATNLQTLAASTGTWSNNPTRFAYKWEDCDASGAGCTAISGATASTYTLALSDVGDTVRVIVTAANAGGSATATSAQTAVIAPALVPWANTPVPMPLAAPTVSGSTAVGATLTCTAGRWSGTPTGYEYRWNRGNAPILNTTAATDTVTTADRGHALSCTVTAVNAGGAIQADSARLSIPAAAKTTAKAKAARKPRRSQHRRALTHRAKKRGQASADERRRPSHSRRHPVKPKKR